MIALVIAKRLSRFFSTDTIRARVAWIEGKEARTDIAARKFPARRALLLGLSAQHLDRGAGRFTRARRHRLPLHGHLDGPAHRHLHPDGRRRRDLVRTGAVYRNQHVFQNLGDGTYFHSGSLAVRQAIAAKVNITYKILYNDAVAMTGGQPVDGTLTVPDIAHQMRAEGVHAIVVMSDEIEKWSKRELFPRDVEFVSRTRSTPCRSACANCPA